MHNGEPLQDSCGVNHSMSSLLNHPFMRLLVVFFYLRIEKIWREGNFENWAQPGAQVGRNKLAHTTDTPTCSAPKPGRGRRVSATGERGHRDEALRDGERQVRTPGGTGTTVARSRQRCGRNGRAPRRGRWYTRWRAMRETSARKVRFPLRSSSLLLIATKGSAGERGT